MNINSLRALIARDGVRYLGKECADKTISLLSAPDVRMVDGSPTQEFIHGLLPTLRARLSNTAHTGKYIFGLEKTIERLGGMEGANRIIGYGFIASSVAGNIYLDDKSESLLGVTIADR